MDYANNTPLHYAIINGNVRLVKILLSRFPKTDIENMDGQTPMDLPMKQDLKYVFNSILM